MAAGRVRVRTTTSPGNAMPGCCSVQQPDERLRHRFYADPGVFVEEPDDPQLPAPPPLQQDSRLRQASWQAWLSDWEERQTASMRRQEENTREMVESVKKDVLEKLAQMEKSTVRSSWKRGVMLKAPQVPRTPGGTAIGEEEKERLLDMKLQDGPAAHPHRRPSQMSLSPTGSLPQSKSLKDVNEAMQAVQAAIGGRRNSKAPAQSFSSTRQSLTMNTQESAVVASTPHDPEEPVPKPPLYRSMSNGSEEFVPVNILQAYLYQFVHHHLFVAFSASLIGVYSIAVGIMANMEMQAAVANGERPTWRWSVDLSFSIFFLLEVVLRLLAEGLYYFKGQEKNWNLFDMIVALAGLLDILTIFDMSLGFLRMLRTFRAVRVLRIIRVFKIFKELRVMIASILCCLVPVTWAFALLVVVIYIFAVILMNGATDYLQDATAVPDDIHQSLARHFGDLARTIYSLTQAVSGGRNWAEFADPFLEVSPMYGVLFALFVVFVIFGVLNILTGVFVEGTTALANVDKELVIQEQMARNESAVCQIRNLFREIDVDNSGTITQHELTSNLDDDRVKAYFAVLQMDVSEAQGLFELLDIDGSGEVSIEEFIMTCMRLKGSARSLDLASMLFESKRLYTAIRTFMKSVDDSTRDIKEKLKVLQSYTEAAIF